MTLQRHGWRFAAAKQSRKKFVFSGKRKQHFCGVLAKVFVHRLKTFCKAMHWLGPSCGVRVSCDFELENLDRNHRAAWCVLCSKKVRSGELLPPECHKVGDKRETFRDWNCGLLGRSSLVQKILSQVQSTTQRNPHKNDDSQAISFELPKILICAVPVERENVSERVSELGGSNRILSQLRWYNCSALKHKKFCWLTCSDSANTKFTKFCEQEISLLPSMSMIWRREGNTTFHLQLIAGDCCWTKRCSCPGNYWAGHFTWGMSHSRHAITPCLSAHNRESNPGLVLWQFQLEINAKWPKIEALFVTVSAQHWIGPFYAWIMEKLRLRKFQITVQFWALQTRIKESGF